MDKLSTIKERWFEKQMLMLEDRGLNKTQIANKLGIIPQHLNSMISGARGLRRKRSKELKNGKRSAVIPPEDLLRLICLKPASLPSV